MRVQQVIQRSGSPTKVEVLDLETFDRHWRIVDPGVDIEEGDTLYWQGLTGYLTRDGKFDSREIGMCRPAAVGKAKKK